MPTLRVVLATASNRRMQRRLRSEFQMVSLSTTSRPADADRYAAQRQF